MDLMGEARRANSWIVNLGTALIWVPSFLALAMTVLVTVNVFLRYVLNRPMEMEQDLVVLMLLGVLWLGQPFVFGTGRTITVDFISSNFSPRMRAIADIVGSAIAIWFFAMITVGGWEMAIGSFEEGAVSPYIPWIPVGAQQLTVPLSAGAVCLQLVAVIGRNIVALASGRPLPALGSQH